MFPALLFSLSKGYKFNVFYPDLIDRQDTPKYHLEKADHPGFAILRFHAGPPYEDIAFKVRSYPPRFSFYTKKYLAPIVVEKDSKSDFQETFESAAIVAKGARTTGKCNRFMALHSKVIICRPNR